jgi:tetratricopeptide (TPR) repeat protein
MLRASPRLFWVLVGCAAALLAGCGGARSRYLSHMHRGEQYLAAGEIDKASVEFRNALQIEPRAARALYLNGRVEERRGNLRDALGSYQAAIDADPDQTAARAAAGRMLVLSGAAPRALALISPGLARHGNDARLLTVRGAARAQLNDLDGALADAQGAVRLAPDDADAIALLAALYQRRGETARAVDLVVAAVTRQPTAIDLRQILAGLYLAAGQDGRSEEQLKQIVALAPKELPHRYQLALFYARAGKPEAARQVLEQAVAALPESEAAKLAMVQFLASRGPPGAAEQTLRAYIAREPDDEKLRLGLGELLQGSGAAQQAIAAYGEVVRREPGSAAALTARDRIAAIELASGRSADAEPQIAAVLKQNPQDNAALLMRADLELARANAAAAIADLRAVLRDQPDAPAVQRTLARAYRANGESALAEETLRAAAQAAPADVPVRLDLAQLLVDTGRADAAAALLEEAVRRAPADVQARQGLVRVYLAKRDFASARVAAEDLKTLDPKVAAGSYLAGLVAQQQGRLEDSQREFEHALQLEPASLEVLAALTRVELTRGEGVAAVARVRAFSLGHPHDPKALTLFGDVLTATGAYPEAIRQLNEAVELAPTWPPAWQSLATAHAAQGDTAGAIAAYQSGLARMPYEPMIATGLAGLYERTGSIGQAIALYENLRAHRPQLQLAANNLAMLLVTYRTDPRSLTEARDLTAPFAQSDSAALLDTHGWVRLKLGDLAAALPALERAADRAPDSKVIRYHLGMAEFRAGERDKARADLKIALSGAVRFQGSSEARAALDSLNAAGRS